MCSGSKWLLSKRSVFFSKTNLQHQLQVPKHLSLKCFQRVYPPPIPLKIRKLGCIRLVHKPELWYTIHSLKSSTQMVWKEMFKQEQLLPRPGPVRLKPPEVGTGGVWNWSPNFGIFQVTRCRSPLLPTTPACSSGILPRGFFEKPKPSDKPVHRVREGALKTLTASLFIFWERNSCDLLTTIYFTPNQISP